MNRIALALVLLGGMASAVLAADTKGTQFWNLTKNTLTTVALAPTGATNFGPNQCLNDPDKSVDHDERLKITGVETGNYDVKVADKTRTCVIRNVHVTAGKVFSIDEKELTDCAK
jgi:hypothetical protein